jgi:hypothetical protein
MLEKMIECNVAMLQKKPKQEVQDKYLKYLNEYDNKEKNVEMKQEHRDFFYRYLRYMERSKE